jgi:hypothetical protein
MKPRGRIASIQQLVAEAFGVSLRQMMSRQRSPDYVRPRLIGMYLARETTGLPFRQIGRAFDRDHSTVSDAHTRVAGWIEAEPALRQQVSALRAQIDEQFAADLDAAKLVETIAGKVTTAYRDWLLDMAKLDGEELLRRFGREP